MLQYDGGYLLISPTWGRGRGERRADSKTSGIQKAALERGSSSGKRRSEALQKSGLRLQRPSLARGSKGEE